MAASIAAVFLPHNGLTRYDRTILSGQDRSSDFLRERARNQWVLSCNRQVCACVNTPEDQINLNKPCMRLLCFGLTAVTYRSQPCQTQGSSKHCVQSLKHQTNPKVGNMRELPHRNQPLRGFTPLLVLPHWGISKLFHRHDPGFSKDLWGWEGRR